MANQDVKNTQETSVIVSSHENSITTNDMFDQARAKSALMVASSIAASNLIPFHYQRHPENVMVAMYRAARLGMDMFAYMETTYPVNGKLGHEAKFIVALINKSQKFKSSLRYEMAGEIKRDNNGLVLISSTRKCTAWAISKDDGERLEQSVDLAMAFLEGWATKAGADKTLKTNKWHTMPDVMLQYRAAKFFGNMHCPELVMGLHTKDELEDVVDAEVIEQTETGKDIFVKGETVNTAAEPVLDPAMEIRTEPVVVPAEVVVIPEAKVVEVPKPAEVKAFIQIDTSGVLPTDPVEFGNWVQSKFERESTTVDAFLVAKKWIRPGETFPALTIAKLTKLRGMWDQFLTAYETFRKAGER